MCLLSLKFNYGYTISAFPVFSHAVTFDVLAFFAVVLDSVSQGTGADSVDDGYLMEFGKVGVI